MYLVDMILPEKLQDKVLGRVARKIDVGENHKTELQINLGLDKETIGELENDYSRNIRREMFMSLIKWKDEKKNPTFDDLDGILKKSGQDFHILSKVRLIFVSEMF